MTKMNLNLSITLAKIHGQDDTAFILEVIAGEIRRGRISGEEREFSWIMTPS